ncbi:heparan sulfate glucosamine 3-O-sulfotransferase 6-like [Mytilus edulis]|uniref:heparan sulfate glucosamine 3-O-sulfotransferase 6-like n=1 Tax=Mytilus edulis TaxID=6550 RepID=UPI0039F0A68C
MRNLYSGLIFRNFRKIKLYFGLCFLFCVIFVLSGYFGETQYSEGSLLSNSNALEPGTLKDFQNRRHNRNLQFLYSQELLTGNKKIDLKVKTNKGISISPRIFTYKNYFLNEDESFNENKLNIGRNKATDYTNLNSDEKKNKYLTKRLPHAIIIGVKKGGTRALLEFLRAHPNVRATGPEPHFFDKNYEKGLEWYRNLMPESDSSQLTIEKTPGYFITKDVPNRIYNMSSAVKLIIVVRDPVTRAISDFAQIASKSPKVHSSFEAMMFKDNITTVDTSRTLIKIGMYSKHLERWLDYFPLEQFHIVNGENLVTDPGTELIKIQEFLGLPIKITDKNFHFNQTRGFPCIRKKLNKRPHCLDETKGRKHPYINPESIQSLQAFFKPYNRKFSKMVGQDFGWS